MSQFFIISIQLTRLALNQFLDQDQIHLLFILKLYHYSIIPSLHNSNYSRELLIINFMISFISAVFSWGSFLLWLFLSYFYILHILFDLLFFIFNLNFTFIIIRVIRKHFVIHFIIFIN